MPDLIPVLKNRHPNRRSAICCGGLLVLFVMTSGGFSPLWADETVPPAAVTPAGTNAADKVQQHEGELFFEKNIRPLLATHCFECHGSEKQQGDLRLDNRTEFFKGNESGPTVLAGKPLSSRLIQVVIYDDSDVQMPPKGKLSAAEIELLISWIQMGAPWPENETTEQPEADSNHTLWENHWAFQSITDPAPPAVSQAEWCQSPIDHFVLAQLEQQQLTPSQMANRRSLIRRVYFDVIGLPPTYEETEAFVQSTDTTAYEKLVEQLLQSPHYGERWGRHWLDLARYSDTRGYLFTQDRLYKNAWKYRDWVINAFNKDLPYDQFLKYQIAADQLVKDGNTDELSAMGFLTLGRRFLNNIDDIIDDRIDVLSRSTMGLTVTCARCHDHKFDPIPQADYYALYGVFRSSKDAQVEGASPGLADQEKLFDPYVFLRGKAGNRGDKVPRQFLEVVAGPEREPFKQGSGRLELAESIASPENPLTARVIVNRVWHHYFGVGFVPTLSDFGVLSEAPSHPQLLDWLASRLIEKNWSLKSLHRSILLSSTYQQQSTTRPECVAIDPENRLLWKMNLRRLDFEAQRDSILQVTGMMDDTVGGQSVEITSHPTPPRRTIYAFIDRQNLPNLFRTFDFANPDAHSPKRHETTVPQQSLFYLNSGFVMDRAEALANDLAQRIDIDAAAKVQTLYRQLLSRDPGEGELALALEFVNAPDVEGDRIRGRTNVWQYGYGEVDEATQKLKSYTALPHWTGSVWQGGEKIPDDKLGWVSLNPNGGHPGNDLAHAAIRRWISPFAGTVSIRGEIGHASDQGDGVRGRLISSSTGLIQTWDVHHGKQSTQAVKVSVLPGDTLDFVLDCKTGPGFDSFVWKIGIKPDAASELPSAVAGQWNSEADFAGPQPALLSRWSRLTQVLMLSNEFVFID